MTDTPRTDAKFISSDGYIALPEREVVYEFACELERKLAIAVEALAWYADAHWVNSDDHKSSTVNSGFAWQIADRALAAIKGGSDG